MLVDVISSVNEARSDDLNQRTAVVVDVLRATSTIITALEHGCSSVKAVETVCQARSMQVPGDLLGGERYCKKITGFDLGNSPMEYKDPIVAGRRIILTTTNGTRAIQKSMKASHVIAGALLNAASCAQAALQLKKDLIILCSGTQDEFALEDGLCAGLIIEELSSIYDKPLILNDFASAMLYAYRNVKPSIEEAIIQTDNGKRLIKLGYEDDVHYCSQVNRSSIVPILHYNEMIPYSEYRSKSQPS